jgi:hypothetical protein
MNTIRNKLGVLFVLVFWLTLSSLAQDTTCVMITQDEVINFNYQTSKIIDREPVQDTVVLRVEKDKVLCLHLRDKKRRFRDVTTTWDDGEHRHDTFKSKDDVYFTPFGFGSMIVTVGPPKRVQ